MKNIVVFIGCLAAAAAQITDDVVPMEALPDAIFNDPRFRPGAPSADGRIVGGVEVEPNSIPYQMGLLLSTSSGKSWCGGSLISDEWVLTAAHCTENVLSVDVYLGAHKIKEEEKNRVIINVLKSEIKIHEDWNRNNLLNDISLIHLPQKIKLNSNISAIALPRKSELQNKFENESNALATGWGKDSDSATSVSPVLRKVNVPVLDNRLCKSFYNSVITDSHLCVKTKNGKSVCNGDSGGPLVVGGLDGIPILIGATSFGSSLGCSSGYPGVFTRVTAFVQWISKQTGIELHD